MRVLIGCEESAKVRDAFRVRGFDAWSCDLLPTRGDPQWHIQGDLLEVLGDGWDAGIFFPPCTYLSASGLHWNKRDTARARKTEDALDFVWLLLGAPIPSIALENPVGCISSRIRKPDQIIQPYDFNEDASKKTCLWLSGLPELMPTKRIMGRNVNGKERWANQTDSGQNRLGPSPDRARIRSETFQGIADAMADQWGAFIRGQEYDL